MLFTLTSKIINYMNDFNETIICIKENNFKNCRWTMADTYKLIFMFVVILIFCIFY